MATKQELLGRVGRSPRPPGGSGRNPAGHPPRRGGRPGGLRARRGQVFTLKGADHTYRILVETINEGAATLAADGKIIYANRKLAEMLKMPLEKLIGSAIGDYIAPPDREWFEALFSSGKQGASKGEVRLQAADGALVPAYLSLKQYAAGGPARHGLSGGNRPDGAETPGRNRGRRTSFPGHPGAGGTRHRGVRCQRHHHPGLPGRSSFIFREPFAAAV